MRFVIGQHVELTADNPPLCYRQPFASGDAGAHEWQVTVTDRGAPADLAGCTATCYVRREDDWQARSARETVRMSGVVSGSMVSAVFAQQAYMLGGPLLAVMRVASVEGEVVTAAVLRVGSTDYLTDRIIDPEGTIPSLDALLAQIAAMEAATQEGRAAAQDARDAAAAANASLETSEAALSAAQKTQAAASAALEDSRKAVENAQSAAQSATAAAQKIERMTATAHGLPEGSAPTAEITDDGKRLLLALGIPAGRTGPTGLTPRISAEIETGAAGSDAQISVTGTSEDPTIHFLIPRGDTGDIGNLTINGKSPDGAGRVMLDAADIGAYPSGGIRTASLTIAASSWTGSGPYTLTLARADVTDKTWLDIRLDTASVACQTAAIQWETLAGKIVLTTTVKPTGTLSASMTLMEVTA